MKDLHGEAARSVAASQQACVELLCDIESYPRWYPDVVRAVEVLARDGDRATRVRVTLHAAIGPLNRDLEMVLAVSCDGDAVRLQREPNERSDRERFEVKWRARGSGAQQTRLELALDAYLDIPRLVPTGGLADTLASGFVEAAGRELRDGQR